MAVIAPNSEIYLIKCPIELDNLNQLSFANATAQHNYFNGLPKLSLTNATFQRKDGTIRWPGSMESIIEYNYCMYRNKNHGNKWFYAFIDNMEYISDGMTSIKISTDCWQTWQFDITFKRSFVEREHVNDDTFGKHTLEEGLNPGEYISAGAAINYNYVNGALCIACECSDLPDEMLDYSLPDGTSLRSRPRIYNGLPSGSYLLVFSGDNGSGGTAYGSLYQSIAGFLKWMDSDNKSDAIIAMYVVPKSCLPSDYAYSKIWYISNSNNTQGTSVYIPSLSTSAKTLSTYTVYKNTTIDGYTPKNNKCFCYPYNYILISNNGGSDFVYHWEDFYDLSGIINPQFKAYGIINQGCDIKFLPINYKNTSGYDGYIWSVSNQKLPVLSWSSDYYLNWQAKNGWNSVSQSIERMDRRSNDLQNAEEDKDIVQKSGDFLSGVVGWIGTTFNAIKSTISGEDYQASIVPDQAKGNANSGDLNFVVGKSNFTLYKMCCKKEKIQIIDQYFSMYGYLVNSVKIPNITGRTNWNYVKTIGCNIVGDIPQGDLQTLKSMFNNGVTIWHNSSTYLDYSQNNNIV